MTPISKYAFAQLACARQLRAGRPRRAPPLDFRALRGVRSGETSGAHIFERLAERELAMTNNQIK